MPIFSKEYHQTIASLLERCSQLKVHDERFTIIGREALFELLNEDECMVVDKVYRLNPIEHGFKGKKVGIELEPDNAVPVRDQRYVIDGDVTVIPVQFLPRHTFEAFEKMNEAMRDSLGRGLLIESSYRSNAYQALVFLTIFKDYQFDLAKTAKRVAVPGYSQHALPSSLALDFMTEAGIPQEDDLLALERTEEFKWLSDHAAEYSFYLSYPRNNADGVMYEPWHWQHAPKNSRRV